MACVVMSDIHAHASPKSVYSSGNIVSAFRIDIKGEDLSRIDLMAIVIRNI
jgi:hypothetical protein